MLRPNLAATKCTESAFWLRSLDTKSRVLSMLFSVSLERDLRCGAPGSQEEEELGDDRVEISGKGHRKRERAQNTNTRVY